jgi:hypothetical protein
MHWAYVGSVERGERNISLLNIVRLAQAMDVGPEELVRSLRPPKSGEGSRGRS